VGDWRGDEICGRSLRREDEGRREGVRVSCSVAVHAAAGARGCQEWLVYVLFICLHCNMNWIWGFLCFHQ
jgi:hypothetical protein